MRFVLFLFLVATFSINAGSIAWAQKKPAPKKASENIRKPQQLSELEQDEEDAMAVAETSNCRITVISVRHSGYSDMHQLFTTAKDKAECERKSQIHRTNLYPNEVKTKKITVKFLGN